MTINMYSVRLHTGKLAKAKDEAVQITRAMNDAISQALTFKDPDLTDVGLAKKREELVKQFREAGAADLRKLQAEIDYSRDYLARTLQENTASPTDAYTIARTTQKWQQVEMRLNAGQNMHRIIAEADADTLAAIRDYAPAWLATLQTNPGGLEDAVKGWLGQTRTDPGVALNRAILARSAQIADRDTAELITGNLQADVHLAAAKPWLTAAGNLMEGIHIDMAATAIESKYAGEELAATVPDAA